ncbi:Do family serine endopeptidase [Aliagarivorans marinus]|uniref:Do family serine endopeptidase n=1 Tax=Aliagarivorans marinus TaxID=561965 RepID=UPI000404586F|nr:Do family serine endopeptidase [Aliagarivorans marinus]
MKTLAKSLRLLLVAMCLSITSNPSFAVLPAAVGDTPIPSLAPILDEATPAVVNIAVAGTIVSDQQVPDLFRYFFGDDVPQGPQQRPFQGLGSGVIIDAKKGHVITNYHVIHEADEIQVTLKDGRSYDAKVLGHDRQTDVALLQIEADDLTELPLADSDKLRVGDFAIAIGSPFGLEQTVTSGIISALGRSGLNMENLENYIQTDAAINRGNSGGALINLRGELIGMNTMIIAPTGGNVGIGFAIPANMLRNLTEQITQFGEVRRGVLGVAGGELDSDLAKALGTDSQHGAFVDRVMPNSAAAEAGLEAGDIIVSVNGKDVKSFGELRAKIGTIGAGKKVELGVIRDGKRRSFDVVLKPAEETNIQAKVMHPALEGASLSSTTKEAKAQGVLIDSVARNSPAFRNGFEEGDIIVSINKTPITSITDLRKLLETEPSILAINILRGEETLYRIIR